MLVAPLRLLVLAVPALALVAALSGCSDGADPAAATPPTATPPTAASPTAVSSPGAAETTTAPTTPGTGAATAPGTAPTSASGSVRPSASPPATTGGTDTTVAPRAVRTTTAGRTGRWATAEDRVTVAVTSLRRTETRARQPGEVGGAAVAATVTVANRSDAPVDLTDVVVNLTGPDGGPGAALSGSPGTTLPAEVRPGATVHGTYVFALPVERRAPVSATVSLTGEGPVLRYEGTVS